MINKARSSENSAVHYIGNGRMMVCGNGADLWSIQGGTYSSPVFGSLSVQGTVESETDRMSRSLCYTHEVYTDMSFLRKGNREIPEMKIKDCMHPERQIFLRQVSCFGECIMRLATPTYVRRYEYKLFKKIENMTVYTYIIPAGTCYYESLYCSEEIRMLVALMGEADTDGEYFKFGVGDSALIIVTGSAEECLSELKYAVKCLKSKRETGDNAIFRASVGHWACLTSSCPDKETEDTLVSLLARQSADGGIMAAHSLPLSDVNSFYYTLKAFSALSLEEPAARLVSYYKRIAEKYGEDLHTYHGLDTDAYIPDVEGSRAAACMLGGFLLWFEDHGMQKDDDILLRRLFYSLAEAQERGGVLFSGRESEFDAGIIERIGNISSGSSESTAAVIAVCRRYIAFTKEKRLKARTQFEATKANIEKYASEFQDIFACENVLYANCPVQRGASKRLNFVYSVCPECEREGRYAPLSWLEKHPSGRYMCCSCLSAAGNISPYPAERVFSLGGVCVALLCGLLSGRIEKDMLELVKSRAERYVSDISEIPMRCAREDMLVSMVLEKYNIPSEKYNEKLDDTVNPAGAFSTYLCGDSHVGRSGESLPTAMYLCRRVLREKN